MTVKAVRSLLLLLSVASLAACTSLQGPDVAPVDDTPVDTPVETTTAETPATPPSTNPAVVALLDNAHSDASAGRLPAATAAVERALRIEPKNPVLWHELARLKLQQGDYRQAENFAARSNAWAGANKALQARNWHLISEARSLRGDNMGAQSALMRARALEALQ